ncbi:MAG TPA: hypothetical protein VLV87_06885 [Gammaproteobacteria bacterium]|nr:hypothetical protein [Gammaproteobacteria bacterium]
MTLDFSSRRSAWWSYLLGCVALVMLVSQFRFFWMSNDDVAMSFIVDGGGQVLTPGPHLVLTNIAWGYFAYGLHLLGDPFAYATSIYFGLALSYIALVYAFFHSKVNHALAALALFCVYLPTVINPQHTLVAGYLAFAGIALLCNSIERHLLVGGAVACLLLLLSSLVRWDETAFVMLVVTPLCWNYMSMAWKSPERHRWLGLAAAACAAGIGFLLLDYLTFGLGEWREFADTYGYVMLFSDFGVAGYFNSHPAALRGSGFTLSDLALFSHWFYCDTQVFVPQRLAELLQHLTWSERIASNLKHVRNIFRAFDREFMVFLSMALLLLVAHRRRWQMLASLVVLTLLMLLLAAAGRPGIVRVYLPVLAAMLMLGMFEFQVRTWLWSLLIGVAILFINGRYLMDLHHSNLVRQAASRHVRAATCALPKDSLLINWGSSYPFTLNFLPFGSRDTTCNLNFYGLGEYSLAPFALEHLHRYTGGKDLVPALLSGQSFDIFANRGELLSLQDYFQRHYGAELHIESSPVSTEFHLYRIHIAAPLAAALAPVTAH